MGSNKSKEKRIHFQKFSKEMKNIWLCTTGLHFHLLEILLGSLYCCDPKPPSSATTFTSVYKFIVFNYFLIMSKLSWFLFLSNCLNKINLKFYHKWSLKIYFKELHLQRPTWLSNKNNKNNLKKVAGKQQKRGYNKKSFELISVHKPERVRERTILCIQVLGPSVRWNI